MKIESIDELFMAMILLGIQIMLESEEEEVANLCPVRAKYMSPRLIHYSLLFRCKIDLHTDAQSHYTTSYYS